MGIPWFGGITGDEDMGSLVRGYEAGIAGLDHKETAVFEELELHLAFRRRQVFHRFQGIVDQVAGDGYQIESPDG